MPEIKRSRSVRTIKKVIRKKKTISGQFERPTTDDVYGVNGAGKTYEVTTIKIERDGSRSVKSVDNVKSPKELTDYKNSMVLLQGIRRESSKQLEKARDSVKDLRLPKHQKMLLSVAP